MTAVPSAPFAEQSADAWDEVYDVVVAGFGFSGGMAAIAAADEGARVLLLEKGPRPGGNSILSGGSCVYGDDAEANLAYLRQTCGGATDDEVLRVFARGLTELPDLLRGLAHAVGLDIVTVSRPDGAYPFVGSEQICSARVTRAGSPTTIDWVSGGRAGVTLFHVVLENVLMRDRITVRYDSPAHELVTAGGRVVGCVASVDGQRRRIGARSGLVLCTGGFEHDHEMIRRHLGPAPFSAMSPLSNTGDGIRMAQKVGAALWHMQHLHGSYGFHLEGHAVGIRHSVTGARSVDHAMPWIVVDSGGRRFLNEYPPAPQDTPIRDLIRFEPETQSYPRIPGFMICDEPGRLLGPLGRPAMNDPAIAYEWSVDNSREIEAGHILRSDTLEGLATALGVEPRQLSETVSAWNAACGEADPAGLGRPGWTMRPISTPPYYGIEVVPVITNTQGGVVHDAEQRALDSFGTPVPGLYKAGENGSLFGHLYLLGGNNSECFVGGRIAGTNVAREPAVDLATR
jgi:succinate dehydrogenase/fumarate reductase flavoprotein subunit